MNKKVSAILELILSGIFIATGLIILINIELFSDFMPWVMIGFFVCKILLAIIKKPAFKKATAYMIVQIVLNVVVMAMIIVWRDNVDAMSAVIGGSCIVDIICNLVKAIICSKQKDKDSFFGIENIIYILFIVMLFMNQDSNLFASSVLFGIIILYKGLSCLVANMFFRSVLCLSDLGKAIDKVRGIDVVFGLVIVITLTSFILPYIEPNITTVADSWWYCFALITTIGFGDLVAVTAIGRTLSVIIGFYGIIIVSLLTSATVVYINYKNNEK